MCKKETICWACKNYAKCSWKDGIPVKGWKATPTIIANREVGGETVEIPSFRVEQCPQFKQDRYRVSVERLAKICGIGIKTLYRRSYKQIEELLKQKGYKLYITKDKISHYYIEKL